MDLMWLQEGDILEKIEITHWAHEWLTGQGLNDTWVLLLTLLLDLAALAVISLIADYIARRILLAIAHRIVKKTKVTWDDYLLENKVFRNLAHIIPGVIILLSIPYIFRDLDYMIGPLERIAQIYVTILSAAALNRLFKALMRYTEENETFKGKPIKTILQVLQVMNIFVAVIVAFSIIIDAKVGSILGAFAGATAILILIFQDTINGLLANFQITMYDLVEKGDWITFEKFGVDGDVVSIDLTTVKVRNWDNTISSIPAKAFVSDSFVNWRGMKNANMRRIKRNILIDINSIALCDEEMLKRYSKIAFVSDYVEKRQGEIDKYNDEHGYDKGAASINGRHQTNIGVYRAYIKKYLENHPKIAKRDGAMVMVRQLQPTAQGIPLEVYCFSADIVWENYEGIQSDIFDHLYAATEFFDLRLFQSVTGRDIVYSLADRDK
ncbi:mechanosensitive ion channel family protein [Phaeocystidibacter luteus]|uniref:Mechanosensitive ion channel n=1 Tax=Phaeocystidibacter luteus TaxID=911197 RepID=A0A6N6RK04_9FLAO|nr:mechanosensitive ion channel domain-containing protein [Phaeocystidibacter luteus]KAB2814090.1 mechanosensitive ion channel [Phaeocystidibacter luteus]